MHLIGVLLAAGRSGRMGRLKQVLPLPPESGERTVAAAAFDAVERRFADARPDRLDGLRLDWPEKWLLVRPSNTEPVVRAVAEAPTLAEAQRLCREAQAAMLADD